MAFDKFGLRPLIKDDRDYQLGMFVKLPKLSELPPTFALQMPFGPKNQGDTDFCSAYSACGMSEIQEGVELYPEYSFALSKVLSCNPDDWGQSLRESLKAHQKFGAMPINAIDDYIFEKNPQDLRYIENYPEGYRLIAQTYRKKSYFAVTGPYDAYDNIRATILKEGSAVQIGVVFSWDLSQYKLDTVQEEGFGHAMYVIGWTSEGLIVVNSYGKEAGKDGKHIMTRKVINSFAGKYGVFCLVDIDPDDAKYMVKQELWTRASIYGKIIILLRNWFIDIWK